MKNTLNRNVLTCTGWKVKVDKLPSFSIGHRLIKELKPVEKILRQILYMAYFCDLAILT